MFLYIPPPDSSLTICATTLTFIESPHSRSGLSRDSEHCGDANRRRSGCRSCIKPTEAHAGDIGASECLGTTEGSLYTTPQSKCLPLSRHYRSADGLDQSRIILGSIILVMGTPGCLSIPSCARDRAGIPSLSGRPGPISCGSTGPAGSDHLNSPARPRWHDNDCSE